VARACSADDLVERRGHFLIWSSSGESSAGSAGLGLPLRAGGWPGSSLRSGWIWGWLNPSSLWVFRIPSASRQMESGRIGRPLQRLLRLTRPWWERSPWRSARLLLRLPKCGPWC